MDEARLLRDVSDMQRAVEQLEKESRLLERRVAILEQPLRIFDAAYSMENFVKPKDETEPGK